MPLPSHGDDKIIEELKTRYTYAMNEWRDIRAAAKDDMRAVAGDPWQQKDRQAREQAGRPCLSLDELHQYFNQVINEIRANERAPKFDPTGNGANDKTARFYADKYREIEYRSQAQVAYTTAFQNAIHQGYGWIRYDTQYAPKSFVQDLWVRECPNPDLIVCDPDALRPSSSDAKYLFDLTSMSVNEFKREFPGAQITSFTPEIIASAPAWISTERVQVAKYWMVEPKVRTLMLVQAPDGAADTVYQDELENGKLPKGYQLIQEREDETNEVCMYLTNGVELLKKAGQKTKKVEWAGKYIPYVSCFGMVIYVDEGSGPKRKILSMTRLARDPYMLYCFYRTSQAELVGMTPKVPYFVRRGSLKPDQLLLLQKSLHQPIAVIEVESEVEGSNGTPEMPQRNPFEPYIQNLEIGAESARRAIQAAMGISPLPSSVQRRNEKSGKALQQIESSQQRGSFHFVDHYESMLQHGGVIYEDLIDKIIDTARDVGVRDAKGESRTVRVNDPQSQGQNDLPSIEGDHTVTISAGPAYESQRAEASDFIDGVVSNIQPIASVAGPQVAAALIGLSIKLKNLGPLGDEMYDWITPPNYREKDGQQSQIPPQIQMQLQQLGQENQQLKQTLQGKTAEVQMKGQIDMAKTQLQEQSETQRSAASDQVSLLKTQITAAASEANAQSKVDAENFRSYVDAMEQRLGKQLDLHLQRVSQVLEHGHERATQLQDHAHEATMAQLTHQNGLEAQAMVPQPTEG